MTTDRTPLKIDTIVVFDTVFNHPALRDITAGKEYQIVSVTDDDEFDPCIVDDSGEPNVRALQICDFRIVSPPTKPNNEVIAAPTHHYIASFSVHMPNKQVTYGNVAKTFEGKIDAERVLYDLRYAAAEIAQVGMFQVIITGVFKL